LVGRYRQRIVSANTWVPMYRHRPIPWAAGIGKE